MTTAIAPTSADIQSDPRIFVLEDVSWDTYLHLREETDNSGHHIRMIYDSGRLVLMAPMLQKHEMVKKLVARLIEELTLELGIGILCLGSTTWRRKDLAKGIEADECYYIKNLHKVIGKERWDLPECPPPDLALEVDISHPPKQRQAVNAALGVDELWQYDGKEMAFYRLSSERTYEVIAQSDALPIGAADVNRFLKQFTDDHTIVFQEFRRWLRSRQS